MLVIRRRPGEGFLVGGNIEIEILEIEGGQVKVGIRAPREVAILRKEIASTREANLASAQEVGEQQLEDTLRRLSAQPYSLPPSGSK